jgi:NAD(P)-dependent dehydrogenase (short-subunit alcohol dehydrogenase family)
LAGELKKESAALLKLQGRTAVVTGAASGIGRAIATSLASVFGLIAPPGQTAYSASKFAVRGFSESLRHELARTNIGVTVVHSRRRRHLDLGERTDGAKHLRGGGRGTTRAGQGVPAACRRRSPAK